MVRDNTTIKDLTNFAKCGSGETLMEFIKFYKL